MDVETSECFVREVVIVIEIVVSQAERRYSRPDCDMALSAQLAEAGLKATGLETSCTITLEPKDGGFAITESHLELKAKVPGATAEAFEKATKAAQIGCPVSKLFNTKITLEAHLEP